MGVSNRVAHLPARNEVIHATAYNAKLQCPLHLVREFNLWLSGYGQWERVTNQLNLTLLNMPPSWKTPNLHQEVLIEHNEQNNTAQSIPIPTVGVFVGDTDITQEKILHQLGFPVDNLMLLRSEKDNRKSWAELVNQAFVAALAKLTTSTALEFVLVMSADSVWREGHLKTFIQHVRTSIIRMRRGESSTAMWVPASLAQSDLSHLCFAVSLAAIQAVGKIDENFWPFGNGHELADMQAKMKIIGLQTEFVDVEINLSRMESIGTRSGVVVLALNHGLIGHLTLMVSLSASRSTAGNSVSASQDWLTVARSANIVSAPGQIPKTEEGDPQPHSLPATPSVASWLNKA
eukprot:TRINITY_DN65663_c0_g1_i1.p1 TRINITY_DN65663_c0_g1~~TRINITY_DN65663_c0_g1_i1.p1  ORF type:complete len:347 (-),score=32.45 TRINITY_DN65663_c0_g1_i1:169-1209(-)